MARGLPRRASAPPRNAVSAKESPAEKQGSASADMELFEMRYRKADKETAAGYKDGKKLFETTSGEAARVGFTQEQMYNLFDDGKGGAVLTHNHPRNRSFGGADLAFFFTTGLSEIRAVSTLFTYSLKDPKGVLEQYRLGKRRCQFTDKNGNEVKGTNGWFGKDLFYDRDRIDEKLKSYEKEPGFQLLAEKVVNGERDIWELSHYRMSRFAEELGLEYSRTWEPA